MPASARVALRTGERELVRLSTGHEFVILLTRDSPAMAPPFCLAHRSRGCWGALTFTERKAVADAEPEAPLTSAAKRVRYRYRDDVTGYVSTTNMPED